MNTDIISTRVFAAPPEELFAAFANPARLALWWGPKGFRNTIHSFDFHPGGSWTFTMHGPDSANYENEKRFVEVDPPRRIAFDHLAPMHGFRMTMDFAPEAGKTRLTWTMRFESAAEGEKFRTFIAEKNEENFDSLERHLLVSLQQNS